MQDAGITQVQLADQAGLSQSSVSRYCGGKTEPSFSDAHTLAKFFGVTMEWLLTGQGARAPDDADPSRSASPATDWRARALAAERQIAELKALLRNLASK